MLQPKWQMLSRLSHLGRIGGQVEKVWKKWQEDEWCREGKAVREGELLDEEVKKMIQRRLYERERIEGWATEMDEVVDG